MQLPDKYIFGLTSTEYRPCFITTYSRKQEPTERKALFHKWTIEQEPVAPGLMKGSHPGGQYSTTLGIVELEDGTVRTVDPSAIRFIDTKAIMDQFIYGEREEVQA